MSQLMAFRPSGLLASPMSNGSFASYMHGRLAGIDVRRRKQPLDDSMQGVLVHRMLWANLQCCHSPRLPRLLWARLNSKVTFDATDVSDMIDANLVSCGGVWGELMPLLPCLGA